MIDYEQLVGLPLSQAKDAFAKEGVTPTIITTRPPAKLIENREPYVVQAKDHMLLVAYFKIDNPREKL